MTQTKEEPSSDMHHAPATEDHRNGKPKAPWTLSSSDRLQAPRNKDPQVALHESIEIREVPEARTPKSLKLEPPPEIDVGWRPSLYLKGKLESVAALGSRSCQVSRVPFSWALGCCGREVRPLAST